MDIKTLGEMLNTDCGPVKRDVRWKLRVIAGSLWVMAQYIDDGYIEEEAAVALEQLIYNTIQRMDATLIEMGFLDRSSAYARDDCFLDEDFDPFKDVPDFWDY